MITVDGITYPSAASLCSADLPVEPRRWRRIKPGEYITTPDDSNPFRIYWQQGVACDYLATVKNWPDWKIQRWLEEG